MTKELQHKIYDLLKSLVLPEVRYNNDLMNILSSIWDVYQRAATGEDYRYKVLGDEIEKHFIMNDDWTDDKLFLSILKIFDDESKFIHFVELLTSVFRANGAFEHYLKLLSVLLIEENLVLYEEQTEQGQTVYRIGDKVNKPQIPDNALKFYVRESNISNAVLFLEKDIK